MQMSWIIGVIAAILALGGFFFFNNTAPVAPEVGESMQKDLEKKMDGDSMPKGVMEDGTGEETAMQKDVMQQETVPDAMMKEDAMKKETDGAMMQKGSYSDYSSEKLVLANTGKVVLFFHAPWCPICRPLDAEFKAKESLLGSVHILKVDFDTATTLRQKYGVTVQHTFVQVDASGNQIAKWSDASTLAAVVAKVK